MGSGRSGTLPDRCVTVVVVTTNEASVLPGLLSSLPAALEGIPAWELVVADNASMDGSRDLVNATFPAATIVPLKRNGGYAAGLNAGIAAARLRGAVLILNPDVRLQQGCVARLLDALALQGTGIAAPRLVDVNGHLWHSLRRDPSVLRAFAEALLGGRMAGRYHLGEVVINPARYQAPGTVDWASGAALLIARRCLETVGPWDESFFLYSDEVDFALRARDRGFVVRYVPDAVATHLGGEGNRSPRLRSLLATNRVRLFARRHGRLHTTAFWAAVTLNEGIRALLRPGSAAMTSFRALIGFGSRTTHLAK